MRSTTAYFAGVGTVAVAIAGGLGGGLLLGDIMSPQQPKHPSSEVTRLEQRASPQPIPAMNGASQPVPYMAATQIANTVAEQPALPQQQQAASPQQAQQPQPQSQPQPAQPQVQQASTKPVEPKPAVEKPAVEQKTPAQAAVAAQPPASAEPRAAPEDSLAKARDADLRREGRRADDKRKWERREKWADKRKWRQRDGDDLRDVEASVREDTEQRSFFGRSEFGRSERIDRSEPRPMFGREPGFGTGRFNLFDD